MKAGPALHPLRVQTTFAFKRFRAYVNLVTTLPPSSRDRRCADRSGGPTGSNCQAETAANCFCLLFLPQLGQFPVSRLITTRTSSSSSLPAESRPARRFTTAESSALNDVQVEKGKFLSSPPPPPFLSSRPPPPLRSLPPVGYSR